VLRKISNCTLTNIHLCFGRCCPLPAVCSKRDLVGKGRAGSQLPPTIQSRKAYMFTRILAMHLNPSVCTLYTICMWLRDCTRFFRASWIEDCPKPPRFGSCGEDNRDENILTKIIKLGLNKTPLLVFTVNCRMSC
jgi:hypothetical protein